MDIKNHIKLNLVEEQEDIDCDMSFGGHVNELADGEMPIGQVNFSGGKDSTAMLLRMLELDDPVNYPVNHIIFCDTHFEFPQLYAYIDFIEEYIQKKYPEKNLSIERVNPKTTWDSWFYGKLTRGENEGKVRGAPLIRLPCWWSREAKIKPLMAKTKEYGATWSFVGIAYDEQGRIRNDPTIRYPLNEWEWTESDCLAYLDHLGLGNSLYESFNRLGCFHCPKQSTASWYSLYRDFPDLFEISKDWDKKSRELTSHGFLMNNTLEDLQEMFEKGYVPKNVAENDCRSCEAVSFIMTGEMTLEDFETDDAIEHFEAYPDSRMHKADVEAEEAKTVWIPPSQAHKSQKELF